MPKPKSIEPFFKLRTGSVIGLVSPAGPVKDPAKLENGIGILKNLGFRIKQYTMNSGNQDDYLAQSDTARAEEFHRMWGDEQVDALMAVRGGFGSLRMIGLLDMDFLKSRPKPLIGFSDITVLLNAIRQETGIPTIHGPVACSLPDTEPSALQSLLQTLAGEKDEYNFRNRLEILRGGTATGRLVGGNLTTMVHLLGTPWDLRTDGTILLMEDTGEPIYKLDRMLTQLKLCGKLEHLAGMVLGSFDLGDGDTLAAIRVQEQLWNRVLELTANIRCPVWGNFPVGHRKDNVALPIGQTAHMNSDTGNLLIKPC